MIKTAVWMTLGFTGEELAERTMVTSDRDAADDYYSSLKFNFGRMGYRIQSNVMNNLFYAEGSDGTYWVYIDQVEDEDDEMEETEPTGRERYNDGTLVELTHTGCDGCCPSVINGVFCHEEGCSQAFRDYMVECFECGDQYFAEDEGEFRNRHRRCEACQYSPCADVDALEDVLETIDELDAQLVA